MGRCYQVETRTVIPGPMVEDSNVGQMYAGQKVYIEQIHCFVVRESATDYCITKDLVRHKVGWLRADQYYTRELDAETVAKVCHKTKCPNKDACEWSTVEVAKELSGI